VSTSPLDGFGRWLARSALDAGRDLGACYRALCEELARRGVPVWRSAMGLEFLDPEVSGVLYVWTHRFFDVYETRRPGIWHSPLYLASPTRIVDETEAPFRRKLNEPVSDMPVLEELRGYGGTDYVMFPLEFVDRSRTAVISFATRSKAGFEDHDIDTLRDAAALFSPYAERYVLRRIAIDLLNTYVGPRTGARVFEGRIERGQAERIEAAIWLADLRGFTRKAERDSIEDVIAALNDWLEIVVDIVEAHGGEVLKFIGDAALAIFPISADRGPQRVCAEALAAAESACTRTDALNATREASGQEALEFGLALHFGEVSYGNIGAPRRLDFTVIGPAVNRASRLQELAKQLGRRVLISRELARFAERQLTCLGEHQLRDIDQSQEVFGLD
jgi:adenylate cyclase